MASLDDAQRPASEIHSLAPAAGKARRSDRRRWLALCALAAGCWLTRRRQLIAATPDVADTSTRSREEALRILPLNQLTAESRRKILAVCESPSIYRRLPQKTVDCDPDLYRFFDLLFGGRQRYGVRGCV
jgi:hypothetical protein